LSDVYYIPGLAMNLAFVETIYDSRYNVYSTHLNVLYKTTRLRR